MQRIRRDWVVLAVTTRHDATAAATVMASGLP